MIRTIYYQEPDLLILDQNQLPARKVYEKCSNAEEVAAAIRTLQVRGAPLIGVAAAYGLALAIKKFSGPGQDLEAYYREKRALLAASRPTAVNLFWALNRMDGIYTANAGLAPLELGNVLIQAAGKMAEEDLVVNRAIGENGQELLGDRCRILTICNAGALATCGYGTALGVVRSAAARGKIEMVWACETRPVLQGARLTVWELTEDGIPVTLLTDNMAAYLMKKGRVDAVIVGADRIAANGDTANKIGTYGLAIMASYHKVPFYVATPCSSIDIHTGSGEQIPIEERNPDEVRQYRGMYFTLPEVDVFNPAFDVTPRQLITAIITEKGIISPPFQNGWPEHAGLIEDKGIPGR